jgi:hypothetical protein
MNNTCSEYRYTLEPGSKKHRCPECGKKTFVAYIDNHTGEYIPEQYGRCDREMKCGYHLNPYPEYARMIKDQEQGINPTKWKPKPAPKPKAAPPPERVHLPVEVLRATQCGYEQNSFIQNLLHNVAYPLQPHEVAQVVGLYQIGTIQSGYRAGAAAFPFIDRAKNIRAIQLKQFDAKNHTTGTGFIHSNIIADHRTAGTTPPDWIEAYAKQGTKVDCLFGEHLLDKYPANPVALVEAPKTAIYSTLYFGFPDNPKNLLWLAVFNLSSLNVERCEVLAGRKVVLFPDLSAPKPGNPTAFEKWRKTAIELNEKIPGARFVVDDLLESNASPQERAKGCDLADYLTRHDWREYRPRKATSKAVEVAAPAPVNVDSVDNAPENKSIFSHSQEPEPANTSEDERIEKLRARREALRAECEALENTFVQAAQRCNVKWYAPTFIKEPHPADKLRELKYWTS